jgi:hypothetical protein
MVDFPVLKAFLYDLATTVVTVVLTWLTAADHLASIGITNPTLVAFVAGLAGAALIGWRRYRIEQAK